MADSISKQGCCFKRIGHLERAMNPEDLILLLYLESRKSSVIIKVSSWPVKMQKTRFITHRLIDKESPVRTCLRIAVSTRRSRIYWGKGHAYLIT
jgi:hypothetical protein